MDARTRNTNKQAESKKDLPADAGPEMKLPKADDEVLGVIAGVEQQLTALRRAHSEHRQAMMELAEKRRELAEASENIRTRESQVEERGEELETREGELTSREVELAEMRQEIETREQDVAQRAARIEQRESKIAQQAEMLERREAQVESRGEDLENEVRAVQVERQRIEMTARELQERAGVLDSRADGLGERESVLVRREVEAEEKLARENEAEAKLVVTEKALRQLEGKIKGRELELGERSKALEEMAERAGALEAELHQTRESLQTALHHAEEKLARERKVSEGLRAQVEVADEAVRDAGASIGRVRELEALLATARAELDTVRGEVDAIRFESSRGVQAEIERAEALVAELVQERERVGLLELEIEDLRDRAAKAEAGLADAADPEAVRMAQAEIDSLRAQMTDLAASADEEITAARQKAEQAEARAAEQAQQAAAVAAHAEAAGARVAVLEAKLVNAETELIGAVRARDELKTQLESAGVGSDEAERLRDALTAAVDRISEAETGAAAARERLETLRTETEAELALLRESLDEKAAAIAKAEQAALETEGENRDLKAKLQELEIELEVSSAQTRPNADEFQIGRRRRLAKQRRILRDQSVKIRRATEALRDRLEQCDQVLQKRAELAQAYHAIVEMRQRNAKREVRGGVVFGVIGMMAVVGMVGAVSWFVAGRIAPGEYAASAVIAGQGGPREVLSEADAEAWQSYMVNLSTDPRFLEQAAERMKRRGITTMGTAGELGREVKDRLVVETPSPSEIRLEWRGEGVGRTQRVLDTYAVALAAVANQNRARRGDGATTVITSEAVAGDEPLDNTRIETAGMIFGGSTGLTLLLGGVLWRRLSAAKARFERDSRMEPLLDDAQWELPTR